MWDWRQLDSHAQRVLTAVLIAVPLVLILAAGPLWSWSLLVGLVSGLGLWESERILFTEGLSQRWQAFHISAGFLFPLAAFLGGASGLHAILVLCLFAGLTVVLFSCPGDPSALARLARFSLSWLYIPYLLSYVLLMGSREQGRSWMFFAIVVVVAGDIGAYYCGKRLGRHKLYECVSPKKTIEGSLGGLLASMAVGTLYGTLCIGTVAPGHLVLLSAFLAAVAQVGDLIESMAKRLAGIKDSSQLLPGHGGVLDRLDSLLFVFPVTWFVLEWIA